MANGLPWQRGIVFDLHDIILTREASRTKVAEVRLYYCIEGEKVCHVLNYPRSSSLATKGLLGRVGDVVGGQRAKEGYGCTLRRRRDCVLLQTL